MIPIGLIREIMTAMCDTELFQVVAPGQKWLFDPYGAAPDELTGRIDKGHTVCLHHTCHTAATGTVCLGVCACVSPNV